MSKRFIIPVFLIASFLCSVFASPTLLAADCLNKDDQRVLGIDPWYAGVCKEGTNDVAIQNMPDDVVIIALNLISIAIQIGGYVAVGFVMWGGIRYMIANGDSGKIASAKLTIQNALIGLLIALSAVAIVKFIAASMVT